MGLGKKFYLSMFYLRQLGKQCFPMVTVFGVEEHCTSIMVIFAKLEILSLVIYFLLEIDQSSL